jgi:hypothetical protein
MKLNQIKLLVTVTHTLLIMSFSSSAQFSGGIMGGINISKIGSFGYSYSNSIVRLNLGTYCKYEFNELFAFNSGLLWSGLGDENSKLSYLQIPLHASYKVGGNSNVRILVGFYGAILIDRDSLNPIDLGLSGGTELRDYTTNFYPCYV